MFESFFRELAVMYKHVAKKMALFPNVMTEETSDQTFQAINCFIFQPFLRDFWIPKFYLHEVFQMTCFTSKRIVFSLVPASFPLVWSKATASSLGSHSHSCNCPEPSTIPAPPRPIPPTPVFWTLPTWPTWQPFPPHHWLTFTTQIGVHSLFHSITTYWGTKGQTRLSRSLVSSEETDICYWFLGLKWLHSVATKMQQEQ